MKKNDGVGKKGKEGKKNKKQKGNKEKKETRMTGKKKSIDKLKIIKYNVAQNFTSKLFE